jgi:hypothetical protein
MKSLLKHSIKKIKKISKKSGGTPEKHTTVSTYPTPKKLSQLLLYITFPVTKKINFPHFFL